MNSAVFNLHQPKLNIQGADQYYAVGRLFCVARNYPSHALEMGADPDREPPFFFTKPACSLLINNQDIVYPSKTQDLQHEVELVVALACSASDITVEQAVDCIYGYAVGNDLTRRDMQLIAKQQRRPWDMSKGFDGAAPISDLLRVTEMPNKLLTAGQITLKINGQLLQQADLSEMIWSVAEIIAELSSYTALKAGDLIFTGTPAGVGSLQRGDVVECEIEGVASLFNKVV